MGRNGQKCVEMNRNVQKWVAMGRNELTDGYNGAIHVIIIKE